MIRPASLIAFVTVLLLPLEAQAFDCSKAASEVEKAICADPQLLQLDSDMSAAYAGLKARFGEKDQKMLARSQKRWLRWRESCPQTGEGTAACITRMTGERLRFFTGAAESGPGIAGEITPQLIVQEGSAKQYDLDIAVLRFSDPKDKGETRFNAIADEIVQAVKLGPHGEDTGEQVYSQQDDMSISYASPALMSVKHGYYSYDGGAHGEGGIENINIDMKTGKVLEIGDLLTEEGAAPLRAACKAELREEKVRRMKEGDPSYDPDKDEFFKDDVIAEHIATVSRWTIREDAVTVTFDAYAIGSYAEGQYECRLPLADVKAGAVPEAVLP